MVDIEHISDAGTSWYVDDEGDIELIHINEANPAFLSANDLSKMLAALDKLPSQDLLIKAKWLLETRVTDNKRDEAYKTVMKEINNNLQG